MIESRLPHPARRFAHHAMATTFELYLVCEDEEYARKTARVAFEEIDRLEQELSRFILHSDVARINALKKGQALRVGLETFECLEWAWEVWRDTGGAFDVTIGRLLKKDADAPPASSPSDDRSLEQDEAGSEKTWGMDLLELARDGRWVGVLSDELTIDLGGIGKGYALDRAMERVADWGIESAVMHSGQSSALVMGVSQDGAWRFEFRSPIDAKRSLGSLRLREGSISGSGVSIRGNHIIDPRAGRPRATQALAAWAVAPCAALSDALSTAFMVLAPDEIDAYCRRRPDVSAILALGEVDRIELRTFGQAPWT